MDKWDRHVVNLIEVEITSDGVTDKFELEPLPALYLADCFWIAKAMKDSGIDPDKNTEEEMSEKLMVTYSDNTFFEKGIRLVKNCLELSYPNVDKMKLEKMANRRFWEFLMPVIEGSMMTIETKKKAEAMYKAKQKKEENESEGPDKQTQG